MAGKVYSTTLPDDLAQHVEDLVEDRDMSQSQAMRHLLREGIQAPDNPPNQEETNALPEFLLDTGTTILAGAIIVGVAGILTGFAGYADIALGSGVLAFLGTAFVIGGTNSDFPTFGGSRE